MCALPSAKKGKYSGYRLPAESHSFFSGYNSYRHRVEIRFWKTTIRLMELVRFWSEKFSSPYDYPPTEIKFPFGYLISAAGGLILGLFIGIVTNLGH